MRRIPACAVAFGLSSLLGVPRLEAQSAATSDGQVPAQVCRPASVSRAAIVTPAAVEQLQGEYELIVMTTQGGGRDTIVHSRLVLERNSPGRRARPNPDITHPLIGNSDIDFTPLGTVNLATSPASRDPADPGVQAVYERDSQILSLVFGNAFLDRLARLHRGAWFEVREVEPRQFRGTWSADYGRPPLPGGYFCAVRRNR